MLSTSSSPGAVLLKAKTRLSTSGCTLTQLVKRIVEKEALRVKERAGGGEESFKPAVRLSERSDRVLEEVAEGLAGAIRVHVHAVQGRQAANCRAVVVEGQDAAVVEILIKAEDKLGLLGEKWEELNVGEERATETMSGTCLTVWEVERESMRMCKDDRRKDDLVFDQGSVGFKLSLRVKNVKKTDKVAIGKQDVAREAWGALTTSISDQ